MAMTSIGDLASSVMLRSRNSQLKADMASLVQDLASGQVSIRDTSLGGSYRTITGIEQSLSRIDAYTLAAKETSGFAGAVQDALGALQETSSGLSTELLTAGNSGSATHARALGTSAVQDFEAAIGRLNSRFADRSLFAGAATDGPALFDAGAILGTLETAVASETSASGVIAVVEAWFDVGGGFETAGYSGSTTTLSPMAVSADRSVTVDVTANDSAIRDVLKGLAIAAMIDRGPTSTTSTDQIALAAKAGEVLLSANGNLLDLRASVGTAQETIEQAMVEGSAEKASMEFALSEILTADPYERATQLEQVETQLEMLYALTARTSRLKLTDYL